MADFSILINSCAAFSDMWENIIFLYDKYWENHLGLFILTDNKVDSVHYNNVISIKGEMSDRLLKALDHVSTKFVFLSFDDYYPKTKVNVSKIESLLKEMEEKNIDYCRIYKKVKTKGKKESVLKYKKLPLKDIYEVNFYPSIWKVESLKKVLKLNEEIWKAEARLTRRFREAELNGIYVKDKGTFEFVDVVRKGKYLRSAYRFLLKNDLFISSRKKRTIKETVALNTRIFIADHAPKWIKNALKGIMHKRGKVYYSDYENTDE